MPHQPEKKPPLTTPVQFHRPRCPIAPTHPEMMSHIQINQMLLLEDKVELDVVHDDVFYIINLNYSVKRDVARLNKI